LKACCINVKLFDCIRAVLTAYSLNSLLPGKTGDLVKARVLTDNKKALIKYSGVTFIEKICDLCVLSFITLIGALLIFSKFWLISSMLSIVIFVLIILSLNHVHTLPIIGVKLNVLSTLIPALRKNIKYLLIGLSFSSLLWVFNLIIAYLLFSSVKAGISMLDIICYWPSSMLTGMIPITFSGVGTRDIAFAYSIGASIENTRLVAGTFLYTFFVYWYLSFLSIICLLLKNIKKGWFSK
jgi:uncharacterized membrane protein YbhN (UPF0104 family)